MPQSISNRFTQRFGCHHPFAAAGMAFAGESAAFVAAVSNAGGIGAFGVGFTPAEQLRAQIHHIRALTDKPFNINFITCFDNDAQIRVCAEERVPIVSFHWGHPGTAHLKLLLDAGISVWEQIGTVQAARAAVDDGVEVIIAQGHEAGGHNYQSLPTFVLVPEIVDAVGPAMVLASGGISDGRGVAAALALGASAAWVGTRLVASEESPIHDENKRRIVAGHGSETCFSAIFGPEWPHFNPMRLHRNRVVAEYDGRLAEVPMQRDHLPEIGRTTFLGEAFVMRKFNVVLPTPATTGDFEEMPWLMGQGIGLIHDIKPTARIVEDMMGEAAAILAGLGGQVA